MIQRLRRSARLKLQNAFQEVLESQQERATSEHTELMHAVGQIRQTMAELQRASEAVERHVMEADARSNKALVDLEWRQRRDLYFAAEVRAAEESVAFILKRMPKVRSFPHPFDTLRFALSRVAVHGMALEFGVATGTTLAIIVENLADRNVYGFDVFTGLPEDWRTGFTSGTFRQDTLPEVPGAELVVGLFEDTLPGFLADQPGPVALLHVDSDLYGAAVTVFDQVGSRLVEGSVIVFDEYFNYPGWQHGEHAAWTEFAGRTGTEFEYLGYTFDHEQLVIQVTRAPQSIVESAG